MRALARETGAWLLLGSLVIDPSGEPDAASDEARLANRSFLDRCGRRDRRALRQDPHVRYRPPGRRELPREQRLPARRRHRRRRDAVGPPRHERLLRCALSAPLSRAGAGRRRFSDGPVGLHGADGQRPLACAIARAGRSRTAASSLPRRNGASTPPGGAAMATR